MRWGCDNLSVFCVAKYDIKELPMSHEMKAGGEVSTITINKKGWQASKSFISSMNILPLRCNMNDKMIIQFFTRNIHFWSIMLEI